MKTSICAVVLSTAAGSAFACDAALLPTFPDPKEMAKCVKSHDHNISLQAEELNRWVGSQKKLADLVYRQQEEIGKLKDEVLALKTHLAIQRKKQ